MPNEKVIVYHTKVNYEFLCLGAGPGPCEYLVTHIDNTRLAVA